MSRKINVFVAIVCLLLLFSFLTMAVQRARIAAWKESSRHNLRLIGLGNLNCESTYKTLPRGCDVDEKHGWMTFIFPFMEASPWYSELYLGLPWEHPANSHSFKIQLRFWNRPNVVSEFSQEGYGLTHYLANPAILHRDSKVKLKSLEAGASNTWLVGEVCGNYTPFGYPYNWRPLTWPLNDSIGGFGGWDDGAHFCMADGSVRFIFAGTDEHVVKELAETMPMPDDSLTIVPQRTFSYSKTNTPRKHLTLEIESRKFSKADRFSVIEFDEHGIEEVAIFAPPQTGDKLLFENISNKYPKIKVLDYQHAMDDASVILVERFANLETLIVGKMKITELGIASLQKLQKLRQIVCVKKNEEIEALFKESLPDCEITYLEQFTYWWHPDLK